MTKPTLIVSDNYLKSALQVVIEGSTGRVTVLNNRLEDPTAVALFDAAAWIPQVQLARLLGVDTSPVQLPFLVRRVALPPPS